MDPDADIGAAIPLDAAVPPPPFVGGGISSPPIPSGLAAFSLPPVVLRGGVVMDPDADIGTDVPLDAAVPPPPFVGGGVSSSPIPSGPAAFSLPPVVLRVLPLRGSSAPVGFIYNASPDPVNGGLVAAASAFFSHQGHQVFHDPCPDLEAYCCSMGVPPLTVVNIDRLPGYLLTSG